MALERCAWGADNGLNQDYHDREWGVPAHDDGRLFEMLILEGMQAGLSWITILRKREAFRAAFDAFDPNKIVAYDEARISKLLADPGIIRNRAKIKAAIQNARAFQQVQAEYGSFDRYIWGFVGGKPIVNAYLKLSDIPAQTIRSQAMSKDLRRRGFNFVGPTICYAFMQACGMVNDHVVTCFRYQELIRTK